MINSDLNSSSKIILTEGYSIRLFTSGDEYHWARIAYEAEEFSCVEEAMDYFEEHFGPHKATLLDCCFFCCDIHGIPIGSATAWFGEADGIIQGMLHWVIVSKMHQGKGLCRPLVTAALQKIQQKYSVVFLTTQPYSFKGIKYIWMRDSYLLKKGMIGDEDGSLYGKLHIIRN